MADVCAPPPPGPPQPSTCPQEGAQQAASDLNIPISSVEIASALPLLSNNKSGAGQGWPSELLRYSYQEVTGGDVSISTIHMLARPLAAIPDAEFQHGVFPEDMKSSLVTPVFKKGDRSDPANSWPIVVGTGEPEENGLRALCQASASYGCEVWAPSAAAVTPIRKFQHLQRSVLRRACRGKEGVPVDIIFQELAVSRWRDF